MPESTHPRATNAEIFSRLGGIDIQLALIKATTDRLDKTVNGTDNHSGLIDDHRALQALVTDHLKRSQEDQDARGLLARETKEAKELLAQEAKESKEMLAKEVKEQHEKISNRSWAIIFAVISVVIAQSASLVVLFLRTGGLR